MFDSFKHGVYFLRGAEGAGGANNCAVTNVKKRTVTLLLLANNRLEVVSYDSLSEPFLTRVYYVV